MLKVALDARIEHGSAGGVESVIIGMAEALSRLDDGDEQYLFLAYPDAAWLKPYCRGRVQVLEVPSSGPGAKRAFADVPGVRAAWHALGPVFGERTVRVPASDGTIERAGVRVMHFLHQWGFRTDVPSVYHPHDLQHVHLPEYFSRWQRHSREVTYRTLCTQARLVAVASKWTRDDVMRHYHLGGDKVKSIPLAPLVGDHAEPPAADLQEIVRLWSLPEAFLFYPANTWPHKNHLGLLEALRCIREERGQSIPLVCSGHQNAHYSAIAKRVRELRLEETVRFVGYVTPHQLRCLYRLCRAVVIPSRFEAASGPLWDAFSTGVAAACSNVTSLPDQAGDAAMIFDPNDPAHMADSIFRLWNDEALRLTLIQRGRLNIARFQWNDTARHFRAHYRRLAGLNLSLEDQRRLDAPPLI